MRFLQDKLNQINGFGARIGAGFALVLLVVMLGYGVSLRVTAGFSDALAVLHLAEQSRQRSAAVNLAVRDFEVGRDDIAAGVVEINLAALDETLEALGRLQREDPQHQRELQTARLATRRYADHFGYLLELERVRRAQLQSMGRLLTRAEFQLQRMGGEAAEDFARARGEAQRVDLARSRATAAADSAKGLLLALSALHQLDAQTGSAQAFERGRAIVLAQARFDQLDRALPLLREALPDQRPAVRQFTRWLNAFRGELMGSLRGAEFGAGQGLAGESGAIATRLQNAADKLYRAALQRYELLDREATAARAALNRATDELGLVNAAQIEIRAIGESLERVRGNVAGASAGAQALIADLRQRIKSQAASTGQWLSLDGLLRIYGGRLNNIDSGARVYWDATSAMRDIHAELEMGIVSLAEGQRRSVLDDQRRAESTLLAAAAVALVLGVLLAGGITRQLSGELGQLSRRMFRLSAGDADIDIPYLQRSDQTGNMARALEVFRDNARALTHYQQHLEELVDERTAELRQASARAERLARVKSEFLANMSHEIRTPLNAVLGLAQIGLRDSGGRQAARTYTQILDSGNHLLGLINAILDFSKIEAGKLVIEQQPIELRRILREARSIVAEPAAERGLALQVSIDERLPDWLCGDALRLRQILLNLLSNAVKFTERGGVSLRASLAEDARPRGDEGGGDENGGDWLCFEVADSGIGMNDEQLSRLFNPFEQADSSTTRRYGGTGLGLAICANLADLMGGRISVSSQPGEGSQFRLHLPLIAAEAPAGELAASDAAAADPVAPLPEEAAAAAQSGRARLAGLRLLVVDDIEINRVIATEMLAPEGAELSTAEHGQRAVELVEQAGGEAFDLVLMDVQMPVMDGYQATRRIAELAPGLPVIGLTAHALDEERRKCLACGMCDHVTKPIDVELLIAAILRHARRATAQAEPPPQPSPVATAAAPADSGSGIDWQALRQRFNGRQRLVDKVTGMVVRDHAESPAQLRNALREGDLQGVAFIAHKLKNVGGTLQADGLTEAAGRTELLAREALEDSAGAAADDVESLAGELAAKMEALLGELRKAG